MPMAEPGSASPPRGRFRANSFPITMSATPTPRFELVSEFEPSKTAAVAIIKHANPCGVAQAPSLTEAYLLALRSDPVSAFGGIVAVNRPLDAETAREIVKIFTEVIIAPDADEEAHRDHRHQAQSTPAADRRPARPAAAGIDLPLGQRRLSCTGRDNALVDDLNLQVVTKRTPTEAELSDLKFAFRVAKHVKSNAIVYAKGGATVGIGAGQMSRVDSSRIAAQKAPKPRRPPDSRKVWRRVRWSPRMRSSPSPTDCWRRRMQARRR